MGDPSGIGPALIAKSLPKIKDWADIVVIGDTWVFNKSKKLKVKSQNYSFIDLGNVNRKGFESGKLKAEYGRASIEYLDKALEILDNREIDCLVTCPVSKEAVHLAGIKGFRGHTEYIAAHTGIKRYAMMLLNSRLKISLATTHIPLKEVSRSLNRERLYQTIYLTYESLKRFFLIPHPRIVVCGLNPHASDNGIIGDEENTVVKPVLRRLKAKIRYLAGPLSADVAILKAANGLYDAAIAIYHDQALIPLKLSDFLNGVNMTLGLPFVRTSPLHGTAFDIAKDSKLANPASFIAAVNLAIKCAQNLKRT